MKIGIFSLMAGIVLCFTTSCSNDDNEGETDNVFKVTVLRQGNKCGIVNDGNGSLDHLIEFDQNQTNLPVGNETIYYAANLPENYKIDGLQISITLRNLEEGEVAYCNTGIGGDDYSFIYVLEVLN